MIPKIEVVIKNIFHLFWLFLPVVGLPQSNSPHLSKMALSQIIEEVDELLQNNDYLMKMEKDEVSLVRIDSIFSASFLPDSVSKVYDSYYQYKSNRLKNDWGLSVHAYYNRNVEPGFSEEEELYSLQRVYLGLDWNVLGGGFMENRKRIRDLKYELEINRLEKQRDAKRTNFIYLYNYIMYIFNREKISALDSRYRVLLGKEQIYSQLYYLREKTWEEVIKVKSSLAEVETRIQSLSDYNWHMQNEIPIYREFPEYFEKLPYVDIDIARAMRYYEQAQVDTALTSLQLEQIENKYRSNLEGWSLRPFVRYNMAQDQSSVSRTYGSVGASARIPIRWGEKRKTIVEIEKDIFDLEQQPIEERKLDIFNFYYTHQFKKYQIVNFKHTLHVVDERIRKECALEAIKSPNFSPVRLIDLVEEKLAVLYELVDLKKDLYLNILKIYSLIEEVHPHDFLVELDLNNLVKKYQGSRMMFVDEELYKRLTVEKLLAYLEMNEVDEVYLSVGKSFSEDKLTKFLNASKASDVRVYAVLKADQFLDDSGNLLQHLSEILAYPYMGMHVETPIDTFVEGNDGPNGFQNLVEVYLLTSEQCKVSKIKCSVSVPSNMPTSFLEKVVPFVDQLCVKCYDSNSAESIVTQLTEEQSVGVGKVVVTLNPEDYKNRMHFEEVAEYVMRETGIHQIAIQNLSSLIRLDMKLQQSFK